MPINLTKISDSECTFTTWGLIVHVRGNTEKEYLEKHYDIYKEELNRIDVRMSNSIQREERSYDLAQNKMLLPQNR